MNTNSFYAIFEQNYIQDRIDIVSWIHNTFLEALNDGYLFSPPSREIYSRLRLNCTEGSSNNRNINSIILSFKYRCDERKNKFKHKVISEFLKPELIEKNIDLNIEQFLKLASKTLAYNNVLKHYENFTHVYKMMYELERFDNYRHLKEFDIIETDISITDHALFKELISLTTEASKNHLPYLKKEDFKDSSYVMIPSYELKNASLIIQENNYRITEQYINKFSHQSFYNYLCDDFINTDETTYLDFIKVFFLNPKYHRSKFVFHCSTQLACFLLDEFAKKIFDSLTQKGIEESKMFISAEGNELKQSNISNSKPKIEHQNYNYCNNLIIKTFDYLDKIPVK